MTSDTISESSLAHLPNSPGTAPHPWIVNLYFDFFFIFGGAVWVFLAINYMFLGWAYPQSATSGSGMSRFLAIVLLLGQHFLANSHNAATYMRIYGSDEEFKRFKFFATWLALSCFPLFFLGISVPSFGGAMVYIYLITVFWHYTAQTFGISLIYCYKQGYILKKYEKETFRWLMLVSSLYVAVRTLTYRKFSPQNFFGVQCPFWGPLPDWLFHGLGKASIFLIIVCLLIILKKSIKEKMFIPFPVIMAASTIALICISTGRANALIWFYVPIFFHGTQYLAVCLAHHIKENNLPKWQTTANVGSLFLQTDSLKYLGLVALIGAFLYVVIPSIFQQLGFDYALVGGVVLAVVNYHHFITDAAIWKLNDAKTRQLLLA
jgi:hypothetical protein